MLSLGLCNAGSYIFQKFKFQAITISTSQISSGMAFLESRRLLHRDLACRNVFLTSSSQVYINIYYLFVFIHVILTGNIFSRSKLETLGSSVPYLLGLIGELLVTKCIYKKNLFVFKFFSLCCCLDTSRLSNGGIRS